MWTTTFLFTRLESLASRVSDSPLSAENVIYEAFVVMVEIRCSFSLMLAWRKGKVDTSSSVIIAIFSIFSFPPRAE